MQLEALLEAVTRHASERPDATALITDRGNWSYADLAVRAEALAGRAVAGELPPHARVAVTAHKTPETIALILALGKMGHPALLLSPELGDAAASDVIRQSGVAARLEAAPCDGGGPGIAVDSQPGAAPAGADPSTGVHTDPDSALLLTTSGTTGTPKAVRLSRRGATRFFGWAQQFFGLRPGTRVLNYAPLNFDLSLLDIWATLNAGGAAILLDSARGGDGAYLRERAAQTQPDLIQAVPMFFGLLCDAAGAGSTGNARATPPARPRHVVLTGEAAGPSLRARIAALFPGARFHNVYGCTETNDSIAFSCDAARFAAADDLPIGRPLAGVEARVIDDAGRVLTGAAEGELLVSTPFQAHGYTDPERTAAAFETREGENGPRQFYRTGDRVARTADGTLYLRGRTDLVVKVRGVRTNLQEIERTIAQHHKVADAVVVAVPDQTAGNRLHAIVECRPGRRPSTLDLRSHCAAYLPRTAVPSRFTLSADPLPRTSTGKPDRQRLAHAYTA